jgi:isocitrate lyase
LKKIAEGNIWTQEKRGHIRENYTIRIIVIFRPTLTKYYQLACNKVQDVSGACSRHGCNWKCLKKFGRKTPRKAVQALKRAILKWIFKKP